jgi:4'-phosphopantetheinyl transferase
MNNSNFYLDELVLWTSEGIDKAMLCYGGFSTITEYESLIQYLHHNESISFAKLKFEKRIRSYLLGRFVAKQAIAALTAEKDLANIDIEPGVFNQPVVVSNHANIQVSITHCDDLGVAIAFPEVHPMGIDLEKINYNKRDILGRQITAFEKKLADALLVEETGLTLLWTVKEALSKTIKTGLLTPFEVFEVSQIELSGNFIRCNFKNFTQYRALSFVIDDYLCSLVLPQRTRLEFDIVSFLTCFTMIALGRGKINTTFTVSSNLPFENGISSERE